MRSTAICGFLLCLLALAACAPAGTEPQPPSTPAESLLAALQAEGLDKNILAELFFDYYASDDEPYHHAYELRLLGNFAYGSQPSWDDASHWLCFFAPHEQLEDGIRWAAADMAAAASLLLDEYELPAEDSAWFTYDDGYFYPVGWDDHGAHYYRLLDIAAGAEEGVFDAAFAVYEVPELWPEETLWDANSAALAAYAAGQGLAGDEIYRLPLDEAVRDMLFARDGGGLAAAGYTINVQFRLSGDSRLPLTYLGCRRAAQEL